MRYLDSPDRRLGLVCIALALIALVLWVPFDVETGLIEKVRRRVAIGDSLLPTVALGFVILGGLLALIVPRSDAPRITRHNLAFAAELLLCFVVAFALMRWAGPLAVDVFGQEANYRALRDTAPWKYIGFVSGGTILVAGLMALGEGRIALRGFVIGLIASLVLIALYDLPFDDLLLPPNGDV